MKRTIGVKRAELLKEWLFAVYGNNQSYYEATLWTGIPDGDDLETVIEDLQDGFYDDDIDDMLDMYSRVKGRYAKDGFYYNGHVFHSGMDCLDAAGYNLPDKILKNNKYNIRAVE